MAHRTVQPTREQQRGEKKLRDLGVTVTFTPGTAHNHTEPMPGCLRCAFAASAERVNEGTRP